MLYIVFKVLQKNYDFKNLDDIFFVFYINGYYDDYVLPIVLKCAYINQ